MSERQGPLSGIKVVELAGIGPGPFAAMLLSDMGAEVVRIDRADQAAGVTEGSPPSLDLMNRGRRSLAVDLKNPAGAEVVLRLVERADALMEGFRPGVAERLGVGPDDCLERNPKLVYGRMTGWGQEGPLAQAAGHDIDYIAISGALHPIGTADRPPPPPLNLVGDFGGGALYLAFGLVCGILEARSSGQGQVVDAAMVDGSAHLTTMFHSFRAMGLWSSERSSNLLDGGAPFYDTYETSDGRYLAIGPIEPKFFAELKQRIGLEGELWERQMDRSAWPAQKAALAEVIRTRTRDEWCGLLEGTDACVSPVLSLEEAPAHPHLQARETFVEVAGVLQPAPAPRFSRTPGAVASPPPHPGQHSETVLADWGFDESQISELRASGAVG
jgi:alpha-methylacyl-CoA racemase